MALLGKYIRLEPLEHGHVDGLVAASAADPWLYQWSPVSPAGIGRDNELHRDGFGMARRW